jgi:UDPglucose--hexose-1-phosphate uridylyltransferase
MCVKNEVRSAAGAVGHNTVGSRKDAIRLFFLIKKEIRLAFSPFSEGNEARTPAEVFAIRPEGGPNTPGWRVRVVPDKYPVLGIEGDIEVHRDGASEWREGVGIHEVVVESADAAKDLADLSAIQASDVFRACQARILDLRRDRRLRYLLVFKNHGVEAGSTIAHSHTQIIGLPITPITVRQELTASRKHFEKEQSCLFCNHLSSELSSGARIVCQNEHFLVYCPFASRFPFKMTVCPVAHSHDFAEAGDDLMVSFGEIMQEALVRLRKTLKDPPYNFCPSHGTERRVGTTPKRALGVT